MQLWINTMYFKHDRKVDNIACVINNIQNKTYIFIIT